MVNLQKWIVIIAAIVGLGLFTQEAAATGLTGTLARTGLAGGQIGSGIQQAGTGAGQGIAGFFRGVLSPFWEIRNIVRGFMNLGSATPWLEDTPNQGGGTNETTGDGGGIIGGGDGTPIIAGTPDVYTGRGFSYYTDPRINPSIPVADVSVTWGTGVTKDLPLSADAIKYYQDIGVEVNNNDGGGTSELSGGGGGIAVNNSPSGWGSNVSTPSGGVASGNLSLGSWGG